MRNESLLAALLVAASCAPAVVAQQSLPADWDKTVAAAVPDAERARKVVDAGRLFEARRQSSLEAARSADGRLKEVFLAPKSTAADRGISLAVFREARRKATIAAVDALFDVKALVSKKEWTALWPKGFFSFGAPPPVLARKVPAAIPSVVPDPVRQKLAMDAAVALSKSAETNASARDKAKARFEKSLAEYGSERDSFIEMANSLEEQQAKTDDALVEGGTRLQKILSPEEWTALVGRLKAETP